MTVSVYSQMLDSCVEQQWSGCHYTNLQWFRSSKMGIHRGDCSNPWKQMLGRNRRQRCRRHKTSDMDMYFQRFQPKVFVYSKLQPFKAQYAISKKSQLDNRLVWANNKCVDLTGGNQEDLTPVSTCCLPPEINPLKALTLFRLKFGTAMAVSTKSGIRATPLITSLKPRKTVNTVQTTVDPVLILGRIVKLSGSSTYTLQNLYTSQN